VNDHTIVGHIIQEFEPELSRSALELDELEESLSVAEFEYLEAQPPPASALENPYPELFSELLEKDPDTIHCTLNELQLKFGQLENPQYPNTRIPLPEYLEGDPAIEDLVKVLYPPKPVKRKKLHCMKSVHGSSKK
jgi:hypothetical protein